ncbi:hypothetical protein GCM10029978_008020 [Actinoallomurus acanthiterrae]
MRGADVLDRDEVGFTDQRQVRKPGGNHPAIGQIPPLHLPIPEPDAGRIDQIMGGGLAVPHLPPRVTRVGQNAPHRGLCPLPPRSVGIALRIGRRRTRDLHIVQRPGDPGHAVPGQPLNEDPFHDRGGVRAGSRRWARQPQASNAATFNLAVSAPGLATIAIQTFTPPGRGSSIDLIDPLGHAKHLNAQGQLMPPRT